MSSKTLNPPKPTGFDSGPKSFCLCTFLIQGVLHDESVNLRHLAPKQLESVAFQKTLRFPNFLQTPKGLLWALSFFCFKLRSLACGDSSLCALVILSKSKKHKTTIALRQRYLPMTMAEGFRPWQTEYKCDQRVKTKNGTWFAKWLSTQRIHDSVFIALQFTGWSTTEAFQRLWRVKVCHPHPRYNFLGSLLIHWPQQPAWSSSNLKHHQRLQELKKEALASA